MAFFLFMGTLIFIAVNRSRMAGLVRAQEREQKFQRPSLRRTFLFINLLFLSNPSNSFKLINKGLWNILFTYSIPKSLIAFI